jgi:AcrR family transcriptional regulator
VARKPADQSVNRADIIHAAAEVLQRSGYEAATMKEIAAEVNLTAASLYHHFRNKDALLLAVLEVGMNYIIQRVEPIACGNGASADRLRAMIREHIVGVTENTAVGAAMVFEIRALMNVNPPARSATQDDWDAYHQFVAGRDTFFTRRDHFESLFRQVVREGVERGAFRPVDVPLYVKMMLGAHNWVGVWFRPDGRLSGGEIAAQFADMFLAGLSKNRTED